MIQSGILLIDKPEGPSSAQVVGRIKAISGAKKLGHLGTLDPFASGLLLIGVNEGTKVADIFISAAKSYCGVMVLGVATDSQDATGNVIKERPVPPVGENDLKELERKFTGELQQIPPMFSALKKDGVRLYKLARQGKEIPRDPRAIRIETLRLRKLGEAEIELDVTCSRGTYVRTLAADMGEALGCGGHLKSLRRTACGHLKLDNAVTLDELERLVEKEKIPLLPLSSALSHLRAVTWQSGWLSRVRMGQQEILNQIGKPLAGERLVRILDPRGELVALAECSQDIPGGLWRLARVFHG
ncbi:MAG: tRNA pseudouridine(55) synthase TruB [Deltaproteobacteria bacterium]|nr:tRNA pseudouridine(55) synthase TruB [Deltaproteobacteria bacterium]MDZ4342338.1 tRNA pseudouridine(55) synthase TruB [Candidatus Binatia bacterium]